MERRVGMGAPESGMGGGGWGVGIPEVGGVLRRGGGRPCPRGVWCGCRGCSRRRRDSCRRRVARRGRIFRGRTWCRDRCGTRRGSRRRRPASAGCGGVEGVRAASRSCQTRRRFRRWLRRRVKLVGVVEDLKGGGWWGGRVGTRGGVGVRPSGGADLQPEEKRRRRSIGVWSWGWKRSSLKGADAWGVARVGRAG